MEFDFTQTMKQASDAELLKITTSGREDYQPAAVLAAETELASRNLSAERVNAANRTNEEEEQVRNMKAAMPLDLHWKVLTFIFPGIIQIILSGTFKGSGYDRKASELVKWTLFGFGFYIALVMLLVLISMTFTS